MTLAAKNQCRQRRLQQDADAQAQPDVPEQEQAEGREGEAHEEEAHGVVWQVKALSQPHLSLACGMPH